jgi:NTE family protein
MASAAIPAVFASVPIDGLDLIDGGVADHAAISQALSLGAEVIYVLPSGYACALGRPPSTALSTALTLLIEQRLIVEVGHYADEADIRVLPPLCPLSVSSTDFRQGGLLIDQAHATTARWLAEGGTHHTHPERFLSLGQPPPPHGSSAQSPRHDPAPPPCVIPVG